MAQTKILVDSNSYFRLAQNIHPLLSEPFGEEQYTLYPHEDLTFEFNRKARIQNKFHWFTESKFAENRERTLQLGRKEKNEANANFDYIWEHIKENRLNPLEVDARILATALALGVSVVTDDRDMREVAELFGIECIGALELMKMMLDAQHITMELVERVVAQWQYENDCPYSGWEKKYTKLFVMVVDKNWQAIRDAVR